MLYRLWTILALVALVLSAVCAWWWATADQHGSNFTLNYVSRTSSYYVYFGTHSGSFFLNHYNRGGFGKGPQEYTVGLSRRKPVDLTADVHIADTFLQSRRYNYYALTGRRVAGLQVPAWIPALVLTLPAIVWIAVWAWSRRKHTTAAQERTCLRCGYSLRGTPDSAACPECGDALDSQRRRYRFYRTRVALRVLCAACMMLAVALWVLSYHVPVGLHVNQSSLDYDNLEYLDRNYVKTDRWVGTLEVGHGGWKLSKKGEGSVAQPIGEVAWLFSSASASLSTSRKPPKFLQHADSHGGFMGFAYWSNLGRLQGPAWSVYWPAWLPVVLFGAPLAVWALRRARAHRRDAAGRMGEGGLDASDSSTAAARDGDDNEIGGA